MKLPRRERPDLEAAAPQPRSAATSAGLLMVAAAFLFATMGVCVKLASGYYGSTEIVMYRGLVGALLMALLVRRSGGTLRTAVPGMHLWRSISGVSALVLWFYSIAGLPLPTAMSLRVARSAVHAFRALGTRDIRIVAPAALMPEAGEELTLGRFGFRVARADARRLHTLHVSVHAG